jgi:hypothetical protein
MRIPGEILKKYVHFGKPTLNGNYLCWINPPQKDKSAWSAIPISPIKIKEFKDEKWNQPESVLAWIGPLPNYSIDELVNEADDSDLIAFAIGTKEQAKKGAFTQGPFIESIHAQLCTGREGDYVFELHPKRLPKPIKEWSQNEQKFLKIKDSTKTSTKVPKKFKRRKKDKKKAIKDNGKCYWYKGTKKQAAKGFIGCEKAEVPMINTKGKTKGELIWNFNPFWDNPFPEFIWNGKTWNVLSPIQTEKIKKVLKRMKGKYQKNEKKRQKNKTNST